MPTPADTANMLDHVPTDCTHAVSGVFTAIGWDVAFDLVYRGQLHRAARMSPSELTFLAPAPVDPNWLTEIEIGSVRILVNVASCEPHGRGFAVTVRPYALGGTAKATWMQLIGATRPRA